MPAHRGRCTARCRAPSSPSRRAKDDAVAARPGAIRRRGHEDGERDRSAARGRACAGSRFARATPSPSDSFSARSSTRTHDRRPGSEAAAAPARVQTARLTAGEPLAGTAIAGRALARRRASRRMGERRRCRHRASGATSAAGSMASTAACSSRAGPTAPAHGTPSSSGPRRPKTGGLLAQRVLAGPRRARRPDHGSPGAGRGTAPLLLVCAHGRRDPCCARLGVPVYDALAPHVEPDAALAVVAPRRPSLRRERARASGGRSARTRDARRCVSMWRRCCATAGSRSTSIGAARSTRRTCRRPRSRSGDGTGST